LLEVDFVATKGDLTKYIQVTYLLSSEKTKSREFRVLENINDSFPKYLISMDEIKLSHPKGIMHKNVWEFITLLQ
jgi:predicted AAA+ superfamily ATPase